MTQPIQQQFDSMPLDTRSRMQQRWERGQLVFALQLPPLLTIHTGDIVEQVKAHGASFDAVMTMDASCGEIALSSMTAAMILRRAGVEPIVHMHGRDKNRLALQSEMLSIGALNLPNLVVDVRAIGRAGLGRNTDARLVAELTGPALLATAARLRDEAHFISGASIKTPPQFYLGALIDPEEPLSIERLTAAQFLITVQPINSQHDARHIFESLSTLHAAHPHFLRSRPMLVSLPLITGSSRSFAMQPPADVYADSIEALLATMDALAELEVVRGFTIVMQQLADLAVLEPLAYALAQRSLAQR